MRNSIAKRIDTSLLFNLDKAEPLLEEALDIASRLGPAQELNARGNLVNLYLDLRKRDGHNWLNLATPHLLRAIELAKGSSADIGNQIGAKLALAIIQLPPGRQKPDLSPQFGTFLERWIAQIEQAEGPLSPPNRDLLLRTHSFSRWLRRAIARLTCMRPFGRID